METLHKPNLVLVQSSTKILCGWFDNWKVFDGFISVLSVSYGLFDVDAETQGCLQGLSHSYDHFSQRGAEDNSHLQEGKIQICHRD